MRYYNEPRYAHFHCTYSERKENFSFILFLRAAPLSGTDLIPGALVAGGPGTWGDGCVKLVVMTSAC